MPDKEESATLEKLEYWNKKNIEILKGHKLRWYTTMHKLFTALSPKRKHKRILDDDRATTRSLPNSPATADLRNFKTVNKQACDRSSGYNSPSDDYINTIQPEKIEIKSQLLNNTKSQKNNSQKHRTNDSTKIDSKNSLNYSTLYDSITSSSSEEFDREIVIRMQRDTETFWLKLPAINIYTVKTRQFLSYEKKVMYCAASSLQEETTASKCDINYYEGKCFTAAANVDMLPVMREVN